MTARPGHVALVGLRASGKTTLGRALAGATGRAFVDLDEALAERHRREVEGDAPAGAGPGTPAARARPAGELLAELGEPAFRALEARALEEVLAGADGPLVVATGGGCVETERGRELLAGVRCLWLVVPVEELRRRLAADPTPRPALTGGSAVDEVERVAARREPLYAAVAAARVELGGLDVEAAVARLREHL